MANPAQFLQRLRTLWQRLLEPRTQEVERRRQSRLLMSAILALYALAFVTYFFPLILTAIFAPQHLDYFVAEPLAIALIFVSFGIWGIAYSIGKRGHYEYGALLFILSLSVIIHYLGFARLDIESHYLLYYLVVPVLVSSMFLQPRQTLLISVANMLAMIVIEALIPGQDSGDLPVFFVLTITGLVLVVAHYRSRLEEDRKADVVASEERYRALFTTISDGIALYRDRVILEVNPALERMTGYSRDELIGRPIIRFLAPEWQERFAQGSFSMRDGQTAEVVAQAKDGRLFDIEVHILNFMERGGRVCVAMVRDVTARNEAQAQKLALTVERERVHLMRRFITDASHDLRTPLTGILNGVHLIKIAPNKEYREQRIALLEKQAKQLSTLMDNLLTVSRLDKAAKDEFNFERRDLNELVEMVVSDHQYLADEKAVTLTFAPDETLVPVSVDAQELARALRQLVVNAINYTPSGGQVAVSTLYEDNCVIFEVRDTGIGISPEHQERIFEMFYRVDAARKADMGGLGVGLTISQRIVEAHQGHILVDSQPGVGSTFRIILPPSVET